MQTSTELTSLQRAVEIAGGQAALARKLCQLGLNVRQGHVWHWLHKSKRLPAEYAGPIETAVEGRVTRQELRPDLFAAHDAA